MGEGAAKVRAVYWVAATCPCYKGDEKQSWQGACSVHTCELDTRNPHSALRVITECPLGSQEEVSRGSELDGTKMGF